MNAASTIDPAKRQILVSLGNRYVVFGPSSGLPQSIVFDPMTDTEALPRVEDESDVAETRIANTLRVSGMTRGLQTEDEIGDISLIDDAGNRALVELKVRQYDPKKRDYDQGRRLLSEAARAGRHLEVWYFNIERLKLVIMHLDHAQLRIDELTPLDVWERTTEGVFTRAHVVAEVEDWVRRIEALYDDVVLWLRDLSGVRCEQTRTVVMSEEMMQQFAVTDRELPILDILDGAQVVASFVPRGLWLIGAWGRIDVITSEGTRVILALRHEATQLEWRLVSAEGPKRTEPFTKTALLALVQRP